MVAREQHHGYQGVTSDIRVTREQQISWLLGSNKYQGYQGVTYITVTREQQILWLPGSNKYHGYQGATNIMITRK